MADQGRWFKLWTTAATDEKLSNLSLEDLARWCLLGIYLKVHGNEGRIDLSPPCKTLCDWFRVRAFPDVLGVIAQFPNCTVTGVTTVTVTWRNWAKYQGDFSGDRVRQFRNRVTAKKRREERRVTPPASDVEHPPQIGVSADPSPDNGRGSAVPIDQQLVAWLQGTKNLRGLADPKRGDFWAALERAYDRYDWFFFEPEIAKMDAWIEANPQRRPTERGLPRFVRSWFERAVNMGRTKHGQG